jgi:hypothetical protein
MNDMVDLNSIVLQILTKFIGFDSMSIGMIVAGFAIGIILGIFYGITGDEKTKRIAITSFVGIIVAAIGGGLYFYTLHNAILNFVLLSVSYGVGFGLAALISNKHYKKHHGWGFVVLGYTPRIKWLINTYGPGFEDDDETILEAMEKGKRNSKEISIYCHKPEKEIKKRLGFLKQKGVIRWE